MKTKIILIRHGQSIGNLERKFLGHTDLDITELGYQQADCVAEYLKNEIIDVIYSSDLQRAYHTVVPIAKKRNLEIIKNKELREIYAGDWENVYADDLCKDYEKDYGIVWKTDIGNARCTNGESVVELQKRVMTELIKIAKENQGRTVCIGTHATPIRTICAAINNISKDEIKNIPWATNASVTRVEYENGKFKMISYGEDEFLGNIKTVMFKNI